MPLLVRTPSPHPTESLFGFVLRVSESNGYESPRHILQLAGIDRRQVIAPGFPVEMFAKILGQKMEDLLPIAHWTGERSSGHFKILHHNLGRGMRWAPLRLRNPGFCPACVDESGYIDAFWALSAAIACPKHRCRVLRRCSECHKAISWFRPGLLTCECGADLSAAQLTPVDESTGELMTLVQAKLHGHALTTLPNPRAFPVEALSKLPLQYFLEIIAEFGTHNHGDGSNGDSESRVAAAAAPLEQWPHGYHRYLVKIGNRYLSDNPSPAGLFKQFEPIYRGIFRNRAASPDVGFLREEFIRFALLHWGNGVVPKKLLRHLTLTPETRYVTKSEFSKSFGICFQAMNRLIADRTIVTRKVTAGKGTRVVIDLVLSRLPVESTDVLNSCDAAKYLGLPVSVIRYLRGSGIFSTRPRLGHPASWHKDDLQDFMNLGLGLGGAECSGEVTVQLRDVMRLKLRNTAAKATIVAAVFERQIGVVSSVGSNLADLLLDKKQLDAFVLEKRMQIDGRTYSPSETAAQTGLDCQAVVGAIKRGLLSASEFNGRLRVPESAVKRFNADYITLSQVAKNLGTTAPLLWRICREKELPVVVVSRAHGRPDQPVLLRSAYPQLTEYLQANVRPRLRSKSQRNADEKCMLRDYLDNVRENDKTLPRRDGKPNKVVIARACGFTRDVLYSNSSAIALLEEFDMQERHQAGSDKAGPLGMLVKYLNTLRDSGGKLPRKRNHRPNILAIANAGNFSRRLFYRDTEAMSHLNAYASAENCTAIVQGWHHNQVS